MRLASLARRSVALTAATALISSGGIATGVFLGIANAQTVTGITPSAVSNSGTQTFTVSGSGFTPLDTVALVPTFTAPGVGPINGTVIPSNPPSSSAIIVSFVLDNAAPVPVAGGGYDVQVTQGTGPAATTAGCGGPCFSINQPSQPNIIGSAFDTATGRGIGSGKLILAGTNFARGANLQFLLPNGQLDGDLAFTAENGTATGYVSTTQIKGGYTQGANFTAGQHFLRATNTDGQFGQTFEFWQPKISSVTPSRLGQGASTTVVVTGNGFRAGSKLLINANSSDLTVGTSTVNADGTQISALVTVTSSASTSVARTVTVAGPEGGFQSRAGLFSIGAAPTVSAINVPAIGRGAKDVPVTITGTGFVNTNPLTQFSFEGGGVTGATQSVAPDGTSASVLVSAAADAVTRGRSVTATNSDFGTGTLGPNTAGAFPFTVNPAPIISSVAPAGLTRGITRQVTLTGTNFTAPSGATQNMTFAFSGAGVTINGTPTITKGSGGGADIAQLSVSVATGALAGPRDITATTITDKGTSTCIGCISIDALSLTPISSANIAGRTLTFTADALNSSSVAKLSKVGAPASQPDIVATNWTPASNGASGTGVFNLEGATPGSYNASISTGSVIQSCSACFTISASTATLTSIAPNVGGQGAVNLPVTITGTNFSRGMTVTVGPSGSGVAVSNVAYVDPTSMTAQLTIGSNATTGTALALNVVNADGTGSASKAGAFTVTVGPKITKVDPTEAGQGARNKTITLTGTGFVKPVDPAAGSAVSFGSGVTLVSTTVTDATSIVAVVNVDPTATVGAHDVVVTNPDGGRAAVVGGLTINAGPAPTAISPALLRPGQTAAVIISGTGFTDASVPGAAGVVFADVVLNADGTLGANATVDGAAASGARNLTVLNADGGLGTCSGCLTVGTPPGAPTSVTAAAGQKSATVSWVAPASDGGSAITGYTVSAGAGVTPVSVGATATSATISGLTAGTTYTFSVVAQNALGDSAPGTATATPYDVPLPPTSVTASPGDGQASIFFSGANARGDAITEYTVQLSNGVSSIYKAVAGSPVTVVGLANGTTYTVTVAAKNTAGYGSYSTASATVTPALATRLTATKAPATIIAGQAVTYSGALTRSDGVALAGQIVSVRLTPDVGASRIVSVRTASNGTWTFRVTATYNTTARASFAGNSGAQPANAAAFRFGVQTRVTRTAPATGQTTRATTVLQIKGTTSPNKAGRTIGLYRGSTLVGRASVASNGTFVINSKLARGTYTLYIGLGNTSGNVAGRSTNFVVKRS